MSMQVDSRDRLFLRAGFTEVGQSVRLLARLLMLDGQIVPYSIDVLTEPIPVSLFRLLPLSAGHLLSVSVSRTAPGPLGRDIYVEVGIVRDESSLEVPAFLLFSGNIGAGRSLSWPGSIHEGVSGGFTRMGVANVADLGPPVILFPDVPGPCLVTAVQCCLTTGISVGPRLLRISENVPSIPPLTFHDFPETFLPSSSFTIIATPLGYAQARVTVGSDVVVVTQLPHHFVLDGSVEWSFGNVFGNPDDSFSDVIVRFLY